MGLDSFRMFQNILDDSGSFEKAERPIYTVGACCLGLRKSELVVALELGSQNVGKGLGTAGHNKDFVVYCFVRVIINQEKNEASHFLN